MNRQTRGYQLYMNKSQVHIYYQTDPTCRSMKKKCIHRLSWKLVFVAVCTTITGPNCKVIAFHSRWSEHYNFLFISKARKNNEMSHKRNLAIVFYKYSFIWQLLQTYIPTRPTHSDCLTTFFILSTTCKQTARLVFSITHKLSLSWNLWCLHMEQPGGRFKSRCCDQASQYFCDLASTRTPSTHRNWFTGQPVDFFSFSVWKILCVLHSWQCDVCVEYSEMTRCLRQQQGAPWY